MVKINTDIQTQNEPHDIEYFPETEEELIIRTAPTYNHQESPSSLNSKQKNKKGQLSQLNESSAVFEKTAVGCIINFLRKQSPSPIENIIKHVKSNEDSLIASHKGKHKKNAFQIVDYALTWYPKNFLLNDSFHYYLNEEEAQKYERKFILKAVTLSKKNKSIYKEKIKQKRERVEKMKRIKEKIEAELSSGASEISIMTKTYLMLMSGNEKAAEELRIVIRNAYLTFKNII
ncbi:unnamed protein product [Blepharisma stoltei]|uniref:Uncharacterized protein n=1 Tax=Blepharisma stoltei TaxID=1481888 RepID=A0AAU9IDL4_9CILI|nr:unnamed protein product [Blepharisma stoltei]